MKLQQVIKELPFILQRDPNFRKVVLRITRKRWLAQQAQTADRLDQLEVNLVHNENRLDRVITLLEQKIVEDRQRWAENDCRWAENQQQIKALQTDVKRLDQTLGALGTRWGLHSEATFRNALAGLLKDFNGVEVTRVLEYDDEGLVFGRPDQIDLDLIIQDGLLILAELKASVTKSDVHVFNRKVQFYEKRHSRSATRKVIISPQVDEYAWPLAKKLGIEVYSYVEEVKF